MRTTRLPVVEWTDAPTDLNELVRFAERWNLVSAPVPSHYKRCLTGIRNDNSASFPYCLHVVSVHPLSGSDCNQTDFIDNNKCLMRSVKTDLPPWKWQIFSVLWNCCKIRRPSRSKRRRWKIYRGADKSWSRPGRKKATFPAFYGTWRSLPHSQESTNCPYPRQNNPFLCPSHFWQVLVSSLVGLRTYQHNGIQCFWNKHPYFEFVFYGLKHTNVCPRTPRSSLWPPQYKYTWKEFTFQTTVRMVYGWLLPLSNLYSTHANISHQVP